MLRSGPRVSGSGLARHLMPASVGAQVGERLVARIASGPPLTMLFFGDSVDAKLLSFFCWIGGGAVGFTYDLRMFRFFIPESMSLPCPWLR